MKECCVVCGMYGVVNGIGMCECCDEEMRDRRLDGEKVEEGDLELLEEWSRLGFEVVSVKVVEV